MGLVAPSSSFHHEPGLLATLTLDPPEPSGTPAQLPSCPAAHLPTYFVAAHLMGGTSTDTEQAPQLNPVQRFRQRSIVGGPAFLRALMLAGDPSWPVGLARLLSVTLSGPPARCAPELPCLIHGDLTSCYHGDRMTCLAASMTDTGQMRRWDETWLAGLGTDVGHPMASQAWAWAWTWA